MTQSMPAATLAKLPLPAQFNTFTATKVTPLATPCWAPPTVPATCVPCPLQSVSFPSPVVLAPHTAAAEVGMRGADPAVDDVAVTFDAVAS